MSGETPRTSDALSLRLDELSRQVATTMETTVRTVAEEAGANASRRAVGDLLTAVAEIEEANDQSAVLQALLHVGRGFASRTAFFLTRPGTVRGWAAEGFEAEALEALQQLAFDYQDDSPWADFVQGQGVVRLDQEACSRLAERFGANPATEAVLIPFVLRDQLGGALYADRLEGGHPIEDSALRLITHSAARAIETLPFRERSSPTLRGAASEEGVALWAPDPSEQSHDDSPTETAETAPEVEAVAEAVPEIEDAPEIETAPEIEAEPEIEPAPEIEVAQGFADLPEAESSLEADSGIEPETFPEPEIEAAPEFEEVAEVEEAAEVEDVPQVEDVAQVEDVPEIDTAPEVTAATEVEDIPQVEDVPEIEDIAQVEDMPEIEAAPEFEDVPEIEAAPEIEPALPEIEPVVSGFASETTPAIEDESPEEIPVLAPETPEFEPTFEDTPAFEEAPAFEEPAREEMPSFDAGPPTFEETSDFEEAPAFEAEPAPDLGNPAIEEPSLEELSAEAVPEPELEDTSTDIWSLEEDDDEEDDEPTAVGQVAVAQPMEEEPTSPLPTPSSGDLPVGQQTVRLDIAALQGQMTNPAAETLMATPSPVASPPPADSFAGPAPTPVEPAPVEVEPVPVEAPPVEPVPVEPASVEPPPVEPAATTPDSSGGFASPSEDAYVPPAPSQYVPPSEPEPPAEEPKAEESPGNSTQVKPPEDLVGPGLAFASSPSTNNDAEDALHEEARRLARLLVSEIKLYNEEIIEEGRRNGNIYERLKDDIDRSRQMYEERIDPRIRGQEDYFQQELVQRLAGGDAGLMGG